MIVPKRVTGSDLFIRPFTPLDASRYLLHSNFKINNIANVDYRGTTHELLKSVTK